MTAFSAWPDHQAFVASGGAEGAKLRFERRAARARAAYEMEIAAGFFLKLESIAAAFPLGTCHFQYATTGLDGVGLMIAYPGLEKTEVRRLTESNAALAQGPAQLDLVAMARDGRMRKLGEAAFRAFERLCYEASTMARVARAAVGSAPIAIDDAVSLARASGCEDVASFLEASRLDRSTREAPPTRIKSRL